MSIVDDDGLEILTEDECMALVAGSAVGRVAVSVSALPAVFPVNYRLVGGDILFLTGEGLKSRAAVDGAVVGFEVDAIDHHRHTGWSVLLVGQARLVEDAFERAVYGDLGLVTWLDGGRNLLVCIHPEFVSGRRIGREA